MKITNFSSCAVVGAYCSQCNSSLYCLDVSSITIISYSKGLWHKWRCKRALRRGGIFHAFHSHASFRPTSYLFLLLDASAVPIRRSLDYNYVTPYDLSSHTKACLVWRLGWHCRFAGVTDNSHGVTVGASGFRSYTSFTVHVYSGAWRKTLKSKLVSVAVGTTHFIENSQSSVAR